MFTLHRSYFSILFYPQLRGQMRGERPSNLSASELEAKASRRTMNHFRAGQGGKYPSGITAFIFSFIQSSNTTDFLVEALAIVLAARINVSIALPPNDQRGRGCKLIQVLGRG